MTHQDQQDQIIEQVREYVTKRILLGVSEGDLSNTDSFLERGILNSTGILEIVSFIEDQFGIRCEDEEITPENLDSLNSIAAFIQRKATPVRPEVRVEV
jgi:acyl carrier protein